MTCSVVERMSHSILLLIALCAPLVFIVTPSAKL